MRSVGYEIRNVLAERVRQALLGELARLPYAPKFIARNLRDQIEARVAPSPIYSPISRNLYERAEESR